MKNIRLIILDFDETLGDTRRNILLTMRQSMEELSLPVADDEACAATIGLPLRDCFVQRRDLRGGEPDDLYGFDEFRAPDSRDKRQCPCMGCPNGA